MTTIAVKAGIIASDSRSTCGHFVYPEVTRKLFVSEKHGVIYGVAGAYAKGLAFTRILETLPCLPWHSPEVLDLSDFQDEFTVLVLQWDGRLFAFEMGHWFEIQGGTYAIGSGDQAAVAAMLMGADACKAIQIASQVDNGTDSHIVCFGLEELKKPAYLTARDRSRSARSRPTPARTSRPKSRASRKKPA